MNANAIRNNDFPQAQTSSQQAQKDSPSILLVEDDQAILDELYDIIQLEGWQPLVARNVEAAMRVFRHFPEICVVVTDIHFSNGSGAANGIQLISRARAKYADRNITYVVLSGDPDKVEYSRQEGAFHFLPKPLDSEKLISIVKQAIAQRLRKDNQVNLFELEGGKA